MPYIDLARKQESSSVPEKAPDAPRVSYPGLHLDVPVAPDVSLNTEIEAKVKLRLTGVRQDMYGGKKNVCLDFDVMGIDLGEAKKKKNSSEEDLAEAISGDQKELDRD